MTTTPGALIKSSHNSSSVSVRADLTSAHIEVWEALASPGTWWTGHERLAIAQIIRIAIEGAVSYTHLTLPTTPYV